MKKLLAAAAVVATLATALPAAAQGWGRDGWSGDRGVEQRLERGVRNGSISRNEYRVLSRELANLRRLEFQVRRDGRVTPWEAREVERRYIALNERIVRESRDGRYDRRGDDRYGDYRNYDRGWDYRR
jgi:hypothetical protein